MWMISLTRDQFEQIQRQYCEYQREVATLAATPDPKFQNDWGLSILPVIMLTTPCEFDPSQA